jgi:hypothetical protein
VRTSFLLELMHRFFSIPEDDRDVDTEDKFMKCVGNDSVFAPLPFGYARNRPINFSDRHFFAQQWRKKELLQLLDLTDFESLKNLLGFHQSHVLKMRRFVKRLAK